MKNIFYGLVAIVLLMQACSEDAFSTIIEIELPEHESRLAVIARFSNQDSLLRVFVSNSLGVVDTAQYDEISDADVRLLKDGLEVATFQYVPETRYYEVLNAGIVSTDSELARYELRVESPQYGLVTAVQEMPIAPVMNEPRLNANSSANQFGEKLHLLSVGVVDDGDTDNFYELGMTATLQDTFTYWRDSNNVIEIYESINRAFLEPADLTASYGERGSIILSDASFNGQTTDIRANTGLYFSFGIPEEEWENVYTFEVELSTITADEYYYINSLNGSIDASDNPFVEPVIVHENIEGGHGIFTLTNTVNKTF
ncbi:MAG: DUF4249 family protein [Bacteroidota bacterium]